jgi:hypothetical protein
LEVNASHFHTAIPSNATQVPETFLSTYVYGAITLYGRAFQSTLTSLRRNNPGPNTTSTTGLPAYSVWAFSLSLAATKEITIVFSSSPY